MLKTGILNPQLLALVGQFRHTNTVVIADRGFPSWPKVTTVDLSLVDDVPTVLQVLAALRGHCVIGETYMAEEFQRHNPAATTTKFAAALHGIEVRFEAHPTFKLRVPASIGIIRTGDTTPYANLILVSA